MVKTLEERFQHWKDFLLDSNEKIHTNKKGVLMAESLIINNFIVNWFEDFKKDILDYMEDKTAQ